MSKCCDHKYLPITGPIGPTGPTGISGPTGPSGIISSSYAFIYNTSGQTIAAESPVRYDTLGISQGITFVPGTSNIIFNNAGVYSVTFYIQTGGETDNQFAIYINGSISPQSKTYAVFFINPLPNSGYAIITVNTGDVLTIVSRVPILNGVSGILDDLGGPIINASVVITKLN